MHNMAVMEHRVEPKDGVDDFPTQPWGTRAICERLECMGLNLAAKFAWEPACGRGFMARPMEEYFGSMVSSDRYDYGGHLLHDFLANGYFGHQADVIMTNPPFGQADEFARVAMERAPIVALLCRTAFVESVNRYEGLFKNRRPKWIFQFVERLPMVKGRCDQFATTATSYAWFVWYNGGSISTTFEWIAPCRKRLERGPDDYNHPGGSAWNSSPDISSAQSSRE